MPTGKDEEVGGMSPTFYREMRDISADLKQLQLQLSTFNTEIAKMTYGQEAIKDGFKEMKIERQQDSAKITLLEQKIVALESKQAESTRYQEISEQVKRKAEQNTQWIIGLFIGLLFSIIGVLFAFMNHRA